MPDVGEISGNTRTFSDDEYDYEYEYFTTHHGFDYVSPFNVPYDQIHVDSGNRWHIQSWFDHKPTISSRDEYGRKIQVSPIPTEYYNHTQSNNDYDANFSNWSPTQYDIDSGSDYNDSADVVSAGYALSLGPLFLSVSTDNSSGQVERDPYTTIWWDLNLSSSYSWPVSQEDAIGTRHDTTTGLSSSGERLWFNGDSEMSYKFYERRGYNYRSTPSIKHYFNVDTTD